MRRYVVLFVLALMVAGGVTGLSPAAASDTGNAAPQPGMVVNDDPAGFTPHVMDGAVYTMTQVGNTVVVGGSFNTVRNQGSNTDITRRNVFAFDATTGQVLTTFAPNPNSAVYDVLPAADQQSVYVGGNFTSITSGGGTVSVNRLYRADITTGNRVATYTGTTFNGQVRDLSLTGNRLYVAGKFTHIGGIAQAAVGAVNATTGARDGFFSASITGTHQPGTLTNALKLATNPQNTMLVAIGNFGFVNGQTRHQFAAFDLTGGSATLANYYTTLFQSACSSAFETYMTDVQFSPDGSFFAISTTGAFGGATGSLAGTTGCDVVTRFESGASGLNVRPTWTAYPGGDTTHSVEVTRDVVYVGGHQRWQNNPTRGDAAGQGAVSRPGIAALSALNGLPLSWNPTRDRGVGVKDMIATSQGLFVGSDTDIIGGETHRKVAFFPLAGGTVLPVLSPLTLPGDIFRVDSGQSQLLQRGFDGTNVTSKPNPPNGTGWGTTTGAFMINGMLYTTYANGDFTRRTFDGSMYGNAVQVDTADAIVRQTDWHNTDVPSLTSLFYSQGRMYFTRNNDGNLYYRNFHPESDVVGQQRFSTPSVAGVSFSTVRGAFVVGNKLYFATSNGNLNVADWNGSGPVANTAQVLGSAGGGWSSRAMFLYQGDAIVPPQNQPPTASFTVSCTLLNCSFNASASDDPDGDIVSYAWNFGDGTTSTETDPNASHPYASAGARTVTLTVTDDDGLTGTTSRTANPSVTPQTQLTFVAATSTQGNRTAHSVTVPAGVQAGDLLLLFFTGNTTTPTYTGPGGWTQIATQSGDATVGRAYSRIAAGGDAGSTVTVTSSDLAKDVVTVVAYRGVDPGTPVTVAASALQTTSTTAHVTPTVSSPDSEHWLVSYWADKSTDTTSWTLPGAVTQRSTLSGTGGGHISGVLADSNGAVGSGQQGGLTATANSAGGSAVTFSVLVDPG